MRIDDVNRAPQTPSAEKTDQAAQKRALEKNTADGTADQAEVSQLAHALGSRDAERLEQLRLDVQAGNYNVPAEAVAKAIIDDHVKE